MTAIRRSSPLLSWVLCLAVLLGLQLCALQHGQASGLALSGLDGAYCSGNNSGFAPFSVERGEPSFGDWQCPLCQTPAATDNGWPVDVWLRSGNNVPVVARRATPGRRRRYALPCPRAP